ncbi:HD domain-containing phosphohydrolase [Halorhodospira neutriphila]|uniref:HD-GYP domain-containing protein n=1 Tax=Halorhodospira neutriphila TaxID=168379 RepID=A0ABS1E3Z0_9GAMM|nr:hypothetical protein [Halorhodospira neutriphila]
MARVALLVEHSGNRRLLHDYLGPHYTVMAEEELCLEAEPPELVVADPRALHRWEPALRQARAIWSPLLIPVLLMVSGDGVRQASERLGDTAEDVVRRPLSKAELWARIQNLLRLRAFSADLNGRLTDTAAYSQVLERRVAERTEQLQYTLSETVQRLTRASEFRDTDTGRHIARVCHHTRQLADALGCDGQLCRELFEVAALHDVGKIAVPDHVLRKPGPLDAEEWALMKRHTVDGEWMLQGSDSPYLQRGAEVARSHHERYDGTGYPDGLAGDAIPLSARLVQLADVYDALRTERPYKPAFSHEQARRIILEGDGRTAPEHFDPEILRAFERNAAAFDRIQETLKD